MMFSERTPFGDGSGVGVDGMGVEATNRSGRPFTIRSEKRALMLRSASDSSFILEERIARSWIFRSEFAMVFSEFFSTLLP